MLAALDAGVGQVVIAAAGYDGRALRYARPGVRWFELDHPSTQADKRERLGPPGHRPSDVAFVAADFSHRPRGRPARRRRLRLAARSLATARGWRSTWSPPSSSDCSPNSGRRPRAGSELLPRASTAATGAEAAERRRGWALSWPAVGEPMLNVLSADDAEALMRRAGCDSRGRPGGRATAGRASCERCAPATTRLSSARRRNENGHE